MDEFKVEIYSTKRKVFDDLMDYNPSFDSSRHCIIIKKLEKKDTKKLKKYCNRHNVNFNIINTNFERGSSYRRTFFSANKDINGHYFCAYCGRYIPKNKVTVDHIIPINSVKHSPLKQKILKVKGIDNINCEKNLTPACFRCNTFKGTKGGLWIIRGKLGKCQHLWYFRHAIRFSLLNVLVFYIFSDVFCLF